MVADALVGELHWVRDHRGAGLQIGNIPRRQREIRTIKSKDKSSIFVITGLEGTVNVDEFLEHLVEGVGVLTHVKIAVGTDPSIIRIRYGLPIIIWNQIVEITRNNQHHKRWVGRSSINVIGKMISNNCHLT